MSVKQYWYDTHFCGLVLLLLVLRHALPLALAERFADQQKVRVRRLGDATNSIPGGKNPSNQLTLTFQSSVRTTFVCQISSGRFC